MLLTLILLIMPVFANAKEAPATLQVSTNAPWTTPYLEPGLYYAQNYLNDGRVAYCLELGKDNPTGLTVAKIKKLDKGYQYLIVSKDSYKYDIYVFFRCSLLIYHLKHVILLLRSYHLLSVATTSF